MAGGPWSALWGPRLWLRRLGQEVCMWVLCRETEGYEGCGLGESDCLTVSSRTSNCISLVLTQREGAADECNPGCHIALERFQTENKSGNLRCWVP